jgi:hypothetical protein
MCKSYVGERCKNGGLTSVKNILQHCALFSVPDAHGSVQI